MRSGEIIKRLSELVQMEYAVFTAWRQAVSAAGPGTDPVRERIAGFRDDHGIHIANLTAAIRKAGGKEPALSASDAAARAGLPALPEDGDLRAILTTMERDESVINRFYIGIVGGEGGRASFPAGIRSLLQDHYRDEQRHLAYIVAVLVRSPEAMPRGR